MRWVIGLVVGLILVGWVLIEVPVARTESATGPVDSPWRRTIDGWERGGQWIVIPEVEPARLHPSVVGMLELLVSLTVLVGFSVSEHGPSPEATSSEETSRRNGPRRGGKKGPMPSNRLPSIR